MIRYWLSEIYLDPIENTYKPKGWDEIENSGILGQKATVRHPAGYYHAKPGQRVILETDCDAATEARVASAGCIPLTRDFSEVRGKKPDIVSLIPVQARGILDKLE